MIETLRGLHETVNYENESLIKFYNNSDYEGYPLHWHNSIELIMPVQNNYIVTCNQDTFHLREGDILIIQPNVLHQMPAVHGRRFICQASLLPVYSYKMYKTMYTLLPSKMILTPELDADLHGQVQQLLHEINDEHNAISQTAELSMYVKILQILLLIGKASSANLSRFGDKDVEQQNNINNFLAICDYINNHYAERLTLEDVAKKSGYSKYHFDRLFKKYTNESFYQYLNRIRIRNVELLLKDYDVSITEAAHKSGFMTLSSFIRMFKIYHNCTPSEYRSMHCNKR